MMRKHVGKSQEGGHTGAVGIHRMFGGVPGRYVCFIYALSLHLLVFF